MKTLVLVFMVLSSTIAFSEENPAQQMLNAITVCPSEQNPMSSLAQFKGNSFGNIQFDKEALIADVIMNPQLYNPMIMAPIRILGKIRVEMTYPARQGLVCKISNI